MLQLKVWPLSQWFQTSNISDQFDVEIDIVIQLKLQK